MHVMDDSTAVICNVRANVPQKFGRLINKSIDYKSEIFDTVWKFLSL